MQAPSWCTPANSTTHRIARTDLTATRRPRVMAAMEASKYGAAMSATWSAATLAIEVALAPAPRSSFVLIARPQARYRPFSPHRVHRTCPPTPPVRKPVLRRPQVHLTPSPSHPKSITPQVHHTPSPSHPKSITPQVHPPKSPTMSFAAIEGRRIEYAAIPGNAGTGPTLVFLHEGLGSVALWRDFPRK